MKQKFRVCSYVWTWGTFDDIETARNVAKMVIEEEKNIAVLFIRNNETDELIELVNGQAQPR